MATYTKRDSGRWRARVRRRGLPTLSREFKTLHEAKAWAAGQESDFDRGEWRDRSSAEATTLHELLEDYLRDVVPSKRGADVEKLRIKTIQRDPVSRYKLTALTPAVVTQWCEDRLAGGAAGSTINRELNVLSAVINWARKSLMMPIDNPVAMIRRPPQGKARDRRLTVDDRSRLLEAMTDASRPSGGRKRKGNYRTGTRNPWLLPLMQLAVETGMRRGELCLAHWEHVDLEAGTLHLPAEITKTGIARTVPLSPAAQAVLRDLQKQVNDEEEARIFPVSPTAITRAWSRARQRAGVDDLHLHDLRHEAASRLFELGLNVMEVAAVTGHRDLRSLKRYTHIDAGHLARKIAQLQQAERPNPRKTTHRKAGTKRKAK